MAAAVEQEKIDVDVSAMDDTLNTLTGTFNVNKKAHEVIVEGKKIKWKKGDKSKAEYNSVCFDAVFAVICGGAGADTGSEAQESAKSNAGSKKVVPHFTLHYISKTTTLWKPKTVTFNVPENQSESLDITPWVGRIKECIANPELGRPKRLLVFVNPNSGGSKGVQIYNKKAAPLFKLAGVETNVTVTENGDHAGKTLSKCDLDQIDGVVAVGGDGTFLKCFDGLLRRVCHDAGVDVNDATAIPVRPSIPVGIIPAGTGQGMIKGMINTTDPVTATLHIIMGERHILHAKSAFNGGTLLSFGVMLAGYGLFGDSIRISEKARHLGRARYLYGLGKAFKSKRTFDAEIHYKPIQEERTASGSGDETGDCSSESGWEVVKGSFCSIHMFLMDLTQIRLEKKIKEEGFVPADFKVQTLYLYWALQECSRVKFVKSFINLMNGDESFVDNHYIHLRRVKEYKIVLNIPELNEKTSCLNIDGEPNTLVDKTVHIKGHPNLLPVFGAGIHTILGVDKLLEAAKERDEAVRERDQSHEVPVTEL